MLDAQNFTKKCLSPCANSAGRFPPGGGGASPCHGVIEAGTRHAVGTRPGLVRVEAGHLRGDLREKFCAFALRFREAMRVRARARARLIPAVA